MNRWIARLLTLLVMVACQPDLTPSPDAPATMPAQPIPSGGVRLSDTESRRVMSDLVSSDGVPDRAQAALDQVVEAGDTRFVAVLIELMRANQIGIVQGAGYEAHIRALEALSGQSFGDDWPAWIEWYGTTDLTPPPGFTGWKGRLLGRIDEGFAEFLTDDAPSTIRVEEIQWGGVAVDGIPALDNPPTISPDAADYLTSQEPVFGIALNGEARAYPLRILDWHEMANDVVGGVPVSLAYCTLCGAAIAYEGHLPDGRTITFGSSGFLFRSNKLMYDRQTRTLWNHLTGEPVLGELAGSDIHLKLLPVVLTTWADWVDQHPETTVLDLNTGFSRYYEPGAAYGDYFASPDTMFPVWQRSSLLPDKARIYALVVDGRPKAYPLDRLIDEKVVNDRIGETALVLVAARGSVIVQGNDLQIGSVRYEAGGEVRAFERGDWIFKAGDDANTLLDSNDWKWKVTEEALVGPTGTRLARISGHLAYWFGWFSFFPETQVYGVDLP